MDPLAIITAAGSGLGGTILGGGIVWKLIDRWMDGMESKVCRIFETLDKIPKEYTPIGDHIRFQDAMRCELDECVKQGECDKCSQNTAERREERGTRIDRMESKLAETREEMGEIRASLRITNPELERRKHL